MTCAAHPCTLLCDDLHLAVHRLRAPPGEANAFGFRHEQYRGSPHHQARSQQASPQRGRQHVQEAPGINLCRALAGQDAAVVKEEGRSRVDGLSPVLCQTKRPESEVCLL